MNNNSKTNNTLRERRCAQELSQTALAARSRIGLSTLNRIERWHFRTSLETAARLAQALDCKVEDLFPYLGEEAARR